MNNSENNQETQNTGMLPKDGTQTGFGNKLLQFLTESSVSVGKYVIGKLITSLVIGFLSFIIFKIIGINLPLLLAVVIALTNIVPVFGGWAGVIICGIIVVFFNPIYVVYTTLTALLLQIFEQFVLLPVIVGKAIDLNPMFIICVLVVSSILFGFWGVLLAIPIAAIIKIGYKIFKSKKNDNQEINQ